MSLSMFTKNVPVYYVACKFSKSDHANWHSWHNWSDCDVTPCRRRPLKHVTHDVTVDIKMWHDIKRVWHRTICNMCISSVTYVNILWCNAIWPKLRMRCTMMWFSVWHDSNFFTLSLFVKALYLLFINVSRKLIFNLCVGRFRSLFYFWFCEKWNIHSHDCACA